ncbi:hypothetical protein MNEG_7483 [Monoraphidium neglectum]|uniref:Uncharacterized protein n=1 Tax=Monoraphidium neglectum TaxID=145388 RepID=A0A0D2MB22_9CHLO|nr:hypothetical protein MNEG_7483 [Monoraphidium neglectum]KIZ00475.1 hypothetical protein MNEG_7483 [Monoraphidium neglectum]|eukprot:XP_013899494.1 hypothetical protein MNEG_7483 [Monoraphidium neglectum]
MASAVPATAAAGTVALANLVQLCKELCLPVSYKVFEQLPADGGGGGGRESGSGDADPGNPLSCCERSGNGSGGVVTDASVTRALSAGVQQAFLPKFENEGQDEAIADQVTAGAAERYMVVTIKHSGSLVTLSAGQVGAGAGQGWRVSCWLEPAGAAALLRAHYERSCGCSGDGAGGDAALAALRRLMVSLEERRMAVSFEMVTGGWVF